jgi:hypothetical protein
MNLYFKEASLAENLRASLLEVRNLTAQANEESKVSIPVDRNLLNQLKTLGYVR